MSRLLLTLKPLTLLVLLVFAWQLAGRGDERPNIVLIYGDDVGYGDVSCNGQATLLTPNIDRIAREGLRHTDAHCSSAMCTPSRFALLTGKYAFRQSGTGIARGDANCIIQPGSETLASLLQSTGYHTGVVGKWHLGLGQGKVDWNSVISPGPKEIGFDYHFLIPATGDRVPCVYVEQGRVVDLEPADPISVSYDTRIDLSPSGAEQPTALKQQLTHGHDQTIVNGISRIGWMTGGQRARWIDEEMADVITQVAVSFIDEQAPQAQQGKPFFLFFATQDVHVPRVPHSRFVGRSGLGPRGDAMLQLDWCVGQILDKLDELQLSDNTLVIFSSDNGPVLDDGYADEANEKLGVHDPNLDLRGGKYSLFEGGTRVPLVLRWPGHVPVGATSDALVGQVDWARSLASLVGADVPVGACEDSRDQLPWLLGHQLSGGRPHLIHEVSALALRTGQWKYIPPGKVREDLGPWNTTIIDQPGALFDLSEQRSEQLDVADQYPEQVERLRQLHARLKQHSDQPELVGE